MRHGRQLWRGGVLALALGSAAWGWGFSLKVIETEGVKGVFTAEGERVSREVPLVATLEITAPAQWTFSLPELRRRFRGFVVVEDFPAGRLEVGGTARTRWRFRLTPGAEGPWRLMPFVLSAQSSRSGERKQWLTDAVSFPDPLPLPEATGSPECDLAPKWVAPGWRTFGLWALCGVGGLAGALALLAAVRRLRRALRERTLSPAERAKLELERLVQQGLPGRGLYKRFYFELTGVVRRYYERAYALRATRQTTGEFLAALALDARFGEAEREALAGFLSAADRVKFANVQATGAEAEAALEAARRAVAPRTSPA